MKQLELKLHEISTEPREIEFLLDEEIIEEKLGELAHPRSFHRLKGVITIYKVSGAIEVFGTLGGFITVTCGRCLKAAKLPVPESFHAILMKKPRDFDPERELSSDDLEVSYYEGDTIDLEPIIWDDILLSIPMIPLCSEECEGIKYNPGVIPDDKKEDHRWDALKKLHID